MWQVREKDETKILEQSTNGRRPKVVTTLGIYMYAESCYLRMAYRKPSYPFSPTVPMVVASTSLSFLMAFNISRMPSFVSSLYSPTFETREFRTTLSTIYPRSLVSVVHWVASKTHDDAATPHQSLSFSKVDGVTLAVCVDEGKVVRGFELLDSLRSRPNNNVDLSSNSRSGNVLLRNLTYVL